MAGQRRLYRRILDQMLILIDSGEFPVGGRLPPERELAERFNVSRPTVREAIIALEVLDRVEVKTGSGIYVLPFKSGDDRYDPSIGAYELTEARALIEGEAAALAATQISAEQLKALEKALLEMGDEGGHEAADRRFHAIISEATNNKMLLSVTRELWDVREHSPQEHESYQAICELDGQARVDEHREILDALKSRDAARARQAMHSHFARILNKLIAAHEQAQVEEIRRKTIESRKRFSLDHLVSAG